MFFNKQKPKIFCIGQNKTGTTSLKKFFQDHGFKVGDQLTAELMIDDYIARNWKPILKYCDSAEVFQDVPFSNDFLYVLLDHHFPNAKFILSERSTSEEWYNSVTKFHTKLFGNNEQIPTKLDLKNGKYRVKGFIWKSFKEKYGDCNEDLYNKERLIKIYEERNKQIKKYFANKSNFVILNVTDKDSINILSSFLGIEPKYEQFPWENRTSLIK